MKLSTNSRYGLRAMVDLTANYSGTPVSLCSIAQRQCVSESYLEQTFSTLRKAGFIKSVKGAQGGYAPATAPKSTTVGAILRALEGGLSIIEESPVYFGCDPIKQCIRENVWDAIDRSVSDTVESVTLADLAGDYMRMRGNAQEFNI